MENQKETQRCGWCPPIPVYERYHDTEWGRPVHDDRVLFEFLILESFQAGLSWLTILNKRDNFRRAFAEFDPVRVAKFGNDEKASLMGDPGIVRNRLKIEAALINAQAFLDLQAKEGSFSAWLWKHVENRPVVGNWTSFRDAPASTPLSDQLSKELKKLGFRFVGTTIVYSFLQAIGVVNDHERDCSFRKSAV